jgi:hypothetical protein
VKLTALTTTIKIVGFSRAYPDTMRLRDLDGSIKRLTFHSEPDLTADLEIEIESGDGRKTTHYADLELTCEQENMLVRLLHWACEQHRRTSSAETPS